jgi:hypothetical protein
MFRLPSRGNNIRVQPRFFNPNPPSGEGWSLPVMKGKGLARPPVPVKFFGTVAKKDDQKNKKQKHARAEKNKNLINQAVFILSQSTTGRALLEHLTEKKYHIVFDDDKMNAGNMTGLCDPAKKLVYLGGTEDVEILALVLAHEAAHAMQNEQKNLFPTSAHRPDAAIRLSFAIEADAYAHQMQCALELFHGDPGGPGNQVIFPGALAKMRKSHPEIAQAAEEVLKRDPKALENGAVMAASFLGFYEDDKMREFYESMHMDFCDEYAGKHKKGSASQSFTASSSFSREVDSDWIKDRIAHQGRPYLKQHLPTLDFHNMHYSGLHLATVQRIAKFYKEHLPSRTVPRMKVKNSRASRPNHSQSPKPD